MFTRTWVWAIPVAPLTVTVTVAASRTDLSLSTARSRPGHAAADPQLRPSVIDGAPAARFTETLRTLVETAAAFSVTSDPPTS